MIYWSSKSVTRKTKLKLYRTLVVPVLLYGCETWKMNKSDHKEIAVFHNKCLGKIEFGWQDHVRKEELLERAEMEPLSRDVKRRRWKLIGNILRKDKNSDDVIALTWAPEGKRKRGRPKTTWRRIIEKEKEAEG